MAQPVLSYRKRRPSIGSRMSSSHTTDTGRGNEGPHNALASDTTLDFDIRTNFDDDSLFFTPIPMRASSHSAEDSFRLSPTPNTLSSPTALCSTPVPAASVKNVIHPEKVTKRQAQNREAQRRFRERREQERTKLLDLLQELAAENDRISTLLDQTRQKYLTLEARTKHLQTEADILRRWRQEVMSSMAGLFQQPELEEEVLGAMAGSCSYDFWRRGIQLSRAFVVLQTLAGLFAGVQEGGFGGVLSATTPG